MYFEKKPFKFYTVIKCINSINENNIHGNCFFFRDIDLGIELISTDEKQISARDFYRCLKISIFLNILAHSALVLKIHPVVISYQNY